MKKILISLAITSFLQINCMSRARRLAAIVTSTTKQLTKNSVLIHSFKINGAASHRAFATSSNISQKQAYEILGLDQNRRYSQNDLEKIKRQLFFLYHPDRNQKFQQQANQNFVKIQNAMNVIIGHQQLINRRATNLNSDASTLLFEQFEKQYNQWKNDIEYEEFRKEEQKRQHEQKKRQEEQAQERRKRFTTAAVTGTTIAGSALFLKYIDNENKKKEYFDAIQSGDLEKVKKYFEDPEFDPNIKDSKSRQTGLSVAASLGFTQIVNLFMQDSRFTMFNAVDRKWNTALANAVINSKLEVIKILTNDPRIELNRKNLAGYNIFELIDDKNSLSDQILTTLIDAMKNRIETTYKKNSFNTTTELYHNEIFREIKDSYLKARKYYNNDKNLFREIVYKFNYKGYEVLHIAIESNDFELLSIYLKDNKQNEIHGSLFRKISSIAMLRVLFNSGIVKTHGYNRQNCFLEYYFNSKIWDGFMKNKEYLLYDLVNEKYSDSGNTVWHYIAKYGNNFSSSMDQLKEDIDICSKIALQDIKKKNSDGKTPKDLAKIHDNYTLANIYEILEKKADEQNQKNNK